MPLAALSALYVAAFDSLDVWVLAEEVCVGATLLRRLGVRHHGRLLLVGVCVEHELERFVVLEVAACVLVVRVHVEVAAAQLGEISNLGLLRLLRVGIEVVALALYHLPLHEHRVDCWIGGDWPLLWVSGLPIGKLVSVIC